ncbi:hypothetical protein A6C57_01330 [Fibrella sp. ES10-3-2-2]
MTTQVEVITPDIARELLGANTANRKATAVHISFLAKQMKEGRWMLTSAPISIATDGRLLDGQHRLMALVESDTTHPFWVARNCDPAMFAVLDTGRKRSSSDILSIEGAKNVTSLSGLIRLIMLHRDGRMSSWHLKSRTYSNDEVLAFHRENDLSEYLSHGVFLYGQRRLLSSAEYAFVYYLIAPVDQAAAKAFVERIATGAGLAKGSAGLLLRQKLEAAKEQRINLSSTEKYALCIKAWNAERQGTQLTMLKMLAGEGFPVPL